MKITALLAGAAMVLTLGACGSGTPEEAAQVCVDPATNIRYDDAMCEYTEGSPRPSFIWWYIVPGHVIPAYGWPVTYGYSYPPKGYVTRRAPSSGGVIPERSWRQNSTRPGIQPTTAATQPPPVKKRTWGDSKPATQAPYKAPTTTQSKPKWQTYKPPPTRTYQKPPSYTKYR